MSAAAPERVAIDHDDYHARDVGRMPDGRQIFMTAPFVPELGMEEGCEFIALYMFDNEGQLLEARIHKLGRRAQMDEAKRLAIYNGWLQEFKALVRQRIEVRPFSVARYGTAFGLIASQPDEYEGEWTVELLPGNAMAFFEPWDSGEYDT